MTHSGELCNTLRRILLAVTIAMLAMALCASTAYAQSSPPSWWGLADNDTISIGYLFPANTWGPAVDFLTTPAWYTGATWTRGGTKAPQWAATLAGHDGVIGLTDGLQGQGTLDIVVDNEARPGWVKHVWYQFDLYEVGAETCYTHAEGTTSIVFSEVTTIENLSFGWQRVTGSFDIIPQPAWETFSWSFDVQPSGKAAIDNLYIGTHCEAVPEPGAIVSLLAGCVGILGGCKLRSRKPA